MISYYSWTRDDGVITQVFKSDGSFTRWEGGTWIDATEAYRYVINGDDRVNHISEAKAMSLLDAVDAIKVPAEKAQDDRAGSPALEEDRLAVEAEVTGAIAASFAKARERLRRDLGV